ncbi:MAG: response regulator [Patescibacteria group bacterium]
MKKNKFKILLVADEERLEEALVKKMKAEGYNAEWTDDNKKGLEEIKNNKYDLIFWDKALIDVKGYDVLEEFGGMDNIPPIIILSESKRLTNTLKLKKAGVVDHLVEPEIVARDVIRKIHENLVLKDEYATDGKKDKLILLIEDERFLRELIAKKLKRRGYNVVTAIDGEEGLAAAREKEPSLILLDIIMPEMDGFQVLEALKKDKNKKIAEIPVVMLSNLGPDENAKKTKELGALDYLLKADFHTKDILNKIDHYLTGEK